MSWSAHSGIHRTDANRLVTDDLWLKPLERRRGLLRSGRTGRRVRRLNPVPKPQALAEPVWDWPPRESAARRLRLWDFDGELLKIGPPEEEI